MSDEEQKKQSDYQKAPEVPAEVQPLYEAVKAVLAKELSVTEAASRVGLSRNRFQTLMHRGLQGLLEGVSPKAQGRKAKPQREAELEAEVARLKKENERLKSQGASAERLLGVVGDLMRGKLQLRGRARQTGATPGPEAKGNESDEPDGEAKTKLEGARALRALGLALPLIAALVGSSPSTLRRYAARELNGLPPVHRRGPGPEQPNAATVDAGRKKVRELRGLIGAEALSRCVPGLSRRAAAAVKHETLTEMERDRIQDCERICIVAPGLVRGFDAMHVGLNYLLAAADASVPYRTLLDAVSSYDSQSVAIAIERDIVLNGAPLVYRMDRAKCHRTDEVREVLDYYGVLLLQGPPHHPGYYGQLERQNREHRAWLNTCGTMTLTELAEQAEQMLYAWNCSLPRRSFGWRTASELWSQRAAVDVDRPQLREEVKDRAARIQRQLDVRGEAADLAERLAIEQTLTKHGWLIRRRGARC